MVSRKAIKKSINLKNDHRAETYSKCSTRLDFFTTADKSFIISSDRSLKLKLTK
jgi:hypothetical protein